MNWINLDDVCSVAIETTYADEAFVPGNQITKRSILNQYPVTKDKRLWNWIPVHTDSFERDVTCPQSTWKRKLEKRTKKVTKTAYFMFYKTMLYLFNNAYPIFRKL